MTPEEFRQVKDIFVLAAQRRGADRSSFLDQALPGDSDLRHEVESLLEHDEALSGFLDKPAPVAAALRLVGDTLPPRIGSFTVLGRLGTGGMGIVYQAQQERPRRVVALKVLPLALASAERLRRFEYEVQVLARLQDPGIAQIFEAGSAETADGRQPFFTMEMVQGEPITAYAARRQLSIRQRLELLARTCDAVQYAHQRGVIHRDLKPDNILVDANGQPKILDFGVARLTDPDQPRTTLLTGQGQLLGTLAYMSPEQLAGDPHEIDVRSDVYALGVIAYELLGGRPPHDLSGRSLPDAMRVIREHEPPPLSTVARAFRGDLTTLVAKALAKDRKQRYQSAADLAADIRRYLHDEPLLARPPSAAYQFRKFARRNRGLVGGVAGVFVVLAAGMIVSTVLYFQADNAKRREAQLARLKEAETTRALEAEAKSRQRFEQVRTLAHTFIFDIDDAIATLPGSTQARQLLVETALKYLDNLARDAGDDRALLETLAAAYVKVGDVQGSPIVPNLGETAQALESYQKALAIYDAQARTDPENAANRRGRMVTHNKIGDIQRLSGRTAEAYASYQMGLELAQAQVRDDPASDKYERDLLISYALLGDVLASMQRMDEAVADYRRNLEIADRRYRSAPEERRARRDLLISYHKLGQAHKFRQEFDAAQEAFGHALELARALAEADPVNAQARRDVFLGALTVGDIHAAKGRHAEAVGFYQEAVQIMDALATADPADAQARRDLANSWGRVATACAKLGRDEDAGAALQRTIEILEALAEADPSSAVARQDLAYAHMQLGELHAAAGRWNEALESYQRDLELSRALAGSDPANVEVQIDLATAQRNVAEAHRQMAADTSRDRDDRLEHWSRARAALQACLDINLALRDQGRLPPSDAQVPGELGELMSQWDAAFAALQASAEGPPAAP